MIYIFNTSGEYVGFIVQTNLFSPTGEWLGYIVNGNQVYRANDNSFLGYLSSDNRIVRRTDEPNRLYPHTPPHPEAPIIPVFPLRRLKMFPLPLPWFDVFEK